MGGHEVVLERVVEKATAVVTYPMLTRTNYTKWSLVMRVNLQMVGLWEVINTGEGEYRDNRNALAALLRAVPQEMQVGLPVKKTTKEAWEAIKAVRVGVERVKEANTEKLRKEFNELRFKAGEGVEDFSLRLNTLANQLRVLGEDISRADWLPAPAHGQAPYMQGLHATIFPAIQTYLGAYEEPGSIEPRCEPQPGQRACGRPITPSEKEVVKWLLHSVPESFLDLSEVSIEEVVGRLRAMEHRKKTAQSQMKDDAGRLLLTEEEWLARLKIQEGRRGGPSYGGRGASGRGRGRGRGCGDTRAGEGRNDSGNRFGPKPWDVCNRRCKKGHWAWECQQKKAEANFFQEEEGALLMVTATPMVESAPELASRKKDVRHI
ncbi:hypothetical protein U9M48_030712 [Paspalum notatum var. saurae]|uniref:DUF4219 domain-containing protein n=1 Tax=Paspalum notatum var. saurae TaxID=547442 RepID=A0AAQ3U140_PASNO